MGTAPVVPPNLTKAGTRAFRILARTGTVVRIWPVDACSYRYVPLPVPPITAAADPLPLIPPASIAELARARLLDFHDDNRLAVITPYGRRVDDALKPLVLAS